MEVITDLVLPEGLPESGWQQGRVMLRAAGDDERPASLAFEQPVHNTHGRSVTFSTDRADARAAPGQRWCMDIEGIGRFWWTGGSGMIQYQAVMIGRDELLAFWFVHILLPLYMALEERCDFIHGSAVEIDGGAVYLVAPSRFGKSTLAAHCVGCGHALIADDKVATLPFDGGFLAVPSHPYQRAYRRAEDLGCLARGYADAPKFLSALLILEKAAPDEEAKVRKIKGYDKFFKLFSNYIFRFSFLQREGMEFLAGLANAVPFYSLTLPWDLGKLDDALDAIKLARHADTG